MTTPDTKPSGGDGVQPLRVAVAGFSHETNSFVSTRVDLAVLAAAPLLRGEEILDAHRGSRSPTAGFIDAADADGSVTLVPLVSASILPMGLISDEVYSVVMDDLISQLTTRGPWDAILIDLHGAGVSVSHGDMDGTILQSIRQTVGPTTVIGATLDMHANVSPQMIEHADILNLYQTNPHVDTRERAVQNAALTFAAARGHIDPVSHLVQLPLAINILKQGTASEPLSRLMETTTAMEQSEGSLSVSLGLGYPYSDSLKMGATILVVDDGQPGRARERAQMAASLIWEQRESLQDVAATADQAAEMVADTASTVVLLDVGDNVGGGTNGDSTVLAHALERRSVKGVFLVLTDPTAVESAREAGVDGAISVAVGGRSHAEAGGPINVVGTVRQLSDGTFHQRGVSHGGRPIQYVGPTALVECPSFGTLMITSLPFMPFSIEPYEALGVDLSEFRVIVAKGVIAPRAALSSLTDQFILVDTPGASAANFQRFEFTRRRRPLFPFEPDATLDDAIHTSSGLARTV